MVCSCQHTKWMNEWTDRKTRNSRIKRRAPNTHNPSSATEAAARLSGGGNLPPLCSAWHQINLTRPPAALYACTATAADATYLVRDAINVIRPLPLKYWYSRLKSRLKIRSLMLLERGNFFLTHFALQSYPKWRNICSYCNRSAFFAYIWCSLVLCKQPWRK